MSRLSAEEQRRLIKQRLSSLGGCVECVECGEGLVGGCMFCHMCGSPSGEGLVGGRQCKQYKTVKNKLGKDIKRCEKYDLNEPPKRTLREDTDQHKNRVKGAKRNRWIKLLKAFAIKHDTNFSGALTEISSFLSDYKGKERRAALELLYDEYNIS
jgi:hypothetical protein